MPISIQEKISRKNFGVVLDAVEEELLTWAVCQEMQEVYEDGKKFVSGNAQCRRISRMRIVLDKFLDRVKEAVERAEQESE